MNTHVIVEVFKKSFDEGWELMDAIGLISPYFPNTFTPSGGHDVVVPIMRNSSPQLIKKFYRIERCFRDIDVGIVGLSHHLSYFEMLTFGIVGFIQQKPEVIEEIVNQMAYILFEVFHLDHERIFVAYFNGGTIAGMYIPPVTEEEIKIWRKYFKLNLIPVPGRRTFIYAAIENWPAGAGFEIFYDRGSHLPETVRFVEIASINFYKYVNEGGSLREVVNWAIGGGIGLERLAMVIQQAMTIYDIDVFQIIKENVLNYRIKREEIQLFSKAYNIVIDHIRALVFILMDGQKVDSTPRGKILRRLAKRIADQLRYLNLTDKKFIDDLCEAIIFAYQSRYPQLVEMRWNISQFLKNLLEMRWMGNEV